jgi:hypothetical protein
MTGRRNPALFFNTHMTEELQSITLKPEIALSNGKTTRYAGFAAGTFMGMFGEVTIGENEVLDYYNATKDYLARTLEGEKADGLPVDARDHNMADAAGWITTLELGMITDSNDIEIPAIFFDIAWTPVGQQLITDRVLTNFSPTFSPTKKLIFGGSLTNYPGSVDENNVPLFDALQLRTGEIFAALKSQVRDIFSNSNDPQDQQPGGDSMTVKFSELSTEEQDEIRSKVEADMVSKLGLKDGSSIEDAATRLRNKMDFSALEGVTDIDAIMSKVTEQVEGILDDEFALLEQQTELMVAKRLADRRKTRHVSEFVTMLSGGNAENPFGLRIGEPAELKTVMLSLPDDARAKIEAILLETWKHGRVEFSEFGHAGEKVHGTKKLSAPIAALLANHLETGGKLADWFALAQVGEMSDYDLSEYEEKEA